MGDIILQCMVAFLFVCVVGIIGLICRLRNLQSSQEKATDALIEDLENRLSQLKHAVDDVVECVEDLVQVENDS